MKSAKNVKKNAETPVVVKDLPSRNKYYNWNNHFDIMMGDPGVDVIYLDDEDGWVQWNLAVRLLDSKIYT